MMQLPKPAARPLKIFPTDPSRGYAAARTATILVENEPLTPGPCGERLEVVDYDGREDTFYDPVDLDDPAILMQGGMAPSESDPRFHQQMVYAVASRTLANFDRALGRRITLRKGSHRRKLRLFPHAFEGQNAFYDRDLHAILFGYFAADPFDPGSNLPRQTIFTCLSHDIIAHEMTHAIVDRLRRYFLEPSNVDVLAFHEGFADIVALLQHFSFRDLVADELQRNRGDLRKQSSLVELARQFGFASGGGEALRSALDKSDKAGEPDKRLYANVREPHLRGAILVAAVFDGFFETYQTRIRDLIRIATNGTGELPKGDLPPDLLNRVAAEAARTAERQLHMCIRAFDYLPPVDITFGDFLRAIVTADFELNPDDEWGQRAALIEGFRRRGIYPDGVVSLAEEALRWPAAEAGFPKFQDSLEILLPQLLRVEAERFTKLSTDPTLVAGGARHRPAGDEDDDDATETARPSPSVYDQMRVALVQYAQANAAALSLDPARSIGVSGVNAVFRTAPNGGLLIELVAQFVQTARPAETEPDWDDIPVRGGTTIIVGVDGTVRYAIAKPLPHPGLGAANREAQARAAQQQAFTTELRGESPSTPYLKARALRQTYANLRALHGGC